MIKIEDVTIAYQKQTVLEKVNLNIEKGIITTFLGPNGSGKTSLMSSINGTIKPAEGSIFIDGRDISKLKTKSLAKIVATVPQLYNFNFNFSVFDMVLLGRAPHIGYMPKAEDTEKVEEAIYHIGIQHIKNKEFNKLSGGEKQLVMIARAIAQDTEVILLDEPTSYLDLKNQLKVLRIVKEINSLKNVTCIMTLHDPNHALMYSDKIVLFNNGAVETGTIDNIINSKSIFDVYGVKAEIVNIANRKYVIPEY
ncbi:ABC transporter ATP-binding protein [Clostridium grantii]|uniref:Iron complex transport system ATP-binding protein n=1 Tax=Clostridium grantii DSM 8605 TaxID=1121316 RepID=A0A1M5WX79_9CLOT|nr:ABC transporter ATP-binding protein [Clostridium grantii]SHH92012.1 iron complex transport system ATP-binding protein [Clostridium grantii DSM 8605]